MSFLPFALNIATLGCHLSNFGSPRKWKMMRRCETFESIRNGFLYPRRFKATTCRSRADCIGWDGEHWQLLVVVEHVENKNNQVQILQLIWSGIHLFWWKFPGSLQWIHVESAESAVSWLEETCFFHCLGLVPGDSAEGKAPWIALVQHELEKDKSRKLAFRLQLELFFRKSSRGLGVVWAPIAICGWFLL